MLQDVCSSFSDASTEGVDPDNIVEVYSDQMRLDEFSENFEDLEEVSWEHQQAFNSEDVGMPNGLEVLKELIGEDDLLWHEDQSAYSEGSYFSKESCDDIGYGEGIMSNMTFLCFPLVSSSSSLTQLDEPLSSNHLKDSIESELFTSAPLTNTKGQNYYFQITIAPYQGDEKLKCCIQIDECCGTLINSRIQYDFLREFVRIFELSFERRGNLNVTNIIDHADTISFLNNEFEVSMELLKKRETERHLLVIPVKIQTLVIYLGLSLVDVSTDVNSNIRVSHNAFSFENERRDGLLKYIETNSLISMSEGISIQQSDTVNEENTTNQRENLFSMADVAMYEEALYDENSQRLLLINIQKTSHEKFCFTPISKQPTLTLNDVHFSLNSVQETKSSITMSFRMSNTRLNQDAWSNDMYTLCVNKAFSHTFSGKGIRSFRESTHLANYTVADSSEIPSYFELLECSHAITHSIDHSFMNIALRHAKKRDVMGFTLLETVLCLRLKDHVTFLIERMGCDPSLTNPINGMNAFTWNSYCMTTLLQNSLHKLDHKFLLQCWSTYCVNSLKDLNKDLSLPERFRTVMKKLCLECSTLDESSSIQLQNHLNTTCFLVSHFRREPKGIYLAFDIEGHRLGLIFGNNILAWDDYSLLVSVTPCNDTSTYLLWCLFELSSGDKKLQMQKFARSISETSCNWNCKVSSTSYNSGHFCIYLLKKLHLWEAISTEMQEQLLHFTFGKEYKFEKLDRNIEYSTLIDESSELLNLATQADYMSLDQIIELLQENDKHHNDDQTEETFLFEQDFNLEQLEFMRDEFHKVGEGGFSTVYKCFDKVQHQWKVLKIVSTDIEAEWNACKVFQNMKSDFLVPIEDFGMLDDELYILMPYYHFKDLLHFISIQRSLTPKHLMSIFYQIGKALCDIHAHGLIHRDVKLQNIFVEGFEADHNIRVKLGDFGCFIKKSENGQIEDLENYHSFGSETYKPPESSQQIWTSQSDVWSLGVSMLQLVLLLMRKNHESSGHQTVTQITSEELFQEEFKQHVFKCLSKKYEFLIPIFEKCLRLDPSVRINSHSLVEKLEQLEREFVE
ncbi:hypothetical protein C9374_012890 [Naegleria lovaniensis]|uniref:Protein kinase domain-containing protein n=1 Tax=Naegleria lovaniensis TaxID=51637 RepID=A0AA88GC50_NAELO|nr:uncharacterized protein C9374_012890 [Naegleria lovaniensis]KAG2373044.1 hypothetical protein C9374_012890 [Naegleria lovaniensis]